MSSERPSLRRFTSAPNTLSPTIYAPDYDNGIEHDEAQPQSLVVSHSASVDTNYSGTNASVETGAKTPKKVSWASGTREGDHSSAQKHHLLDEEGLDPKAFQSLKYALERHQSSPRDSLPLVHIQTQPSSLSRVVSSTGATIDSTTLYTPAFSQAGSFISSNSSDVEAPSPERTVGESIIEPLETHGLPAPVPEDATESRIFEDDPNARKSEAAAARLVRTHTRGFKLMHGFRGSRPVSEERGKRDARRSKRRIEEAEAIDIEAPRPHNFRWTIPFRRKSHRASDEDNREGERDVEKDGPRSSSPVNPPLRVSTGVLGALLALYNGDGAETPSGASTPALDHGYDADGTGGTITPEGKERTRRQPRRSVSGSRRTAAFARKHLAGQSPGLSKDERRRLLELSDVGEDTDLSPTARGHDFVREHKHGNEGVNGEDLDSDALEPPHPLYARESENVFGSEVHTPPLQASHQDHEGFHRSRRHGSSHSLSELTRTVADGIESGIDKLADASAKLPALASEVGKDIASGLGIDTAPRPPQARNAAGVFGTLITSTGNLTGAAAPAPSQIAPNPTRPGYKLSRYSYTGEVPVGGRAQVLRSGESSPRFDSGRSTASSPGPSGRSTPRSEEEDGEGLPPLSFTTARTNTRPLSVGSDTATLTGLQNGANGKDGARPGGSTSGSSSAGKAKRFVGILKDFPRSYSVQSLSNWGSEPRSVKSAGTSETPSESGEYWDEKRHRWVISSEKEKKKRKRKKAEIFITRHVAEIIQRQEFILKLARAFMMSGAPSHRLPAQIQATARVLDMELSCMYLPDVMLISFDDSSTSTSSIKFIRQGSALNLGKLQDEYELYWKVIHDEISVSDASRSLDVIMQQKPQYKWWQIVFVGGCCSAAICSLAFSGSFVDSLISFPLGALLVSVQLLSVKNELYSNVFEITIATLLSFLAAVLAGTRRFCYSAIASSSVVLILPGFIVLNGSLELSSRNITSGAVRLCYAVMYSLFLGFGLSIGGTVYDHINAKGVMGPEDYSCQESHNPNGPWYQRTPSIWWAFLTVPAYSLFLNLRNHFPYKRAEFIISLVVSCIGWTCNHFSSMSFVNRKDVSSAIGAFAVGVVSNLYGRFFSGNAFVVMITGILFQLPSGLGNGGLLTFAEQNNSQGSQTSYLSGFQTALQLISVSVGLTVGLGLSLVVVFPIQSRKRAGGIFSL